MVLAAWSGNRRTAVRVTWENFHRLFSLPKWVFCNYFTDCHLTWDSCLASVQVLNQKVRLNTRVLPAIVGHDMSNEQDHSIKKENILAEIQSCCYNQKLYITNHPSTVFAGLWSWQISTLFNSFSQFLNSPKILVLFDNVSKKKDLGNTSSTICEVHVMVPLESETYMPRATEHANSPSHIVF